MQLSDRPYQELANQSSLASPWQRQLIVLPTGCGKTITAQKNAKLRGGRTLWLAHTDELVTQPPKSLPHVWPGVSHGIVKAEDNQYMRHVVFASIQSAQQQRRMMQLAEQHWTTVVVDEAHHVLSPGYMPLLQAVGCFTPGGPTMIGLTATPERTDGRDLSDVFEGIVFHMGITTAIEQGYLVTPNVVERPLRADLDALSTERGDFKKKELDLELMKCGVVQQIADAFMAECLDRKTIIFTVSVEQAEATAQELRARGIAAAAVSGAMDREERKRVILRLALGQLQCVVNCMVLTEGFDEPSVDCIILARPTKSKPLMIQMIGRGLRLFPGKKDCKVIDLVGASKRHSLVQAAVLLGLRVEEEKPARAAQLDPVTNPEEYWKQRLLSQMKGVQAAPRSKLNWVTDAKGGWLLSCGVFGTLRLLPQGGDSWHVDVIGARKSEDPTATDVAKHFVLTDRPVAMDVAQAYAEDYIRRVKVIMEPEEDAHWREKAASAKQVAFLRRSGIAVEVGITAATASALITQQMAKREEPASQKQIDLLRRRRIPTPPHLTKREAGRLIGKAFGKS